MLVWSECFVVIFSEKSKPEFKSDFLILIILSPYDTYTLIFNLMYGTGPVAMHDRYISYVCDK